MALSLRSRVFLDSYAALVSSRPAGSAEIWAREFGRRSSVTAHVVEQVEQDIEAAAESCGLDEIDVRRALVAARLGQSLAAPIDTPCVTVLMGMCA